MSNEIIARAGPDLAESLGLKPTDWDTVLEKVLVAHALHHQVAHLPKVLSRWKGVSPSTLQCGRTSEALVNMLRITEEDRTHCYFCGDELVNNNKMCQCLRQGLVQPFVDLSDRKAVAACDPGQIIVTFQCGKCGKPSSLKAHTVQRFYAKKAKGSFHLPTLCHRHHQEHINRKPSSK